MKRAAIAGVLMLATPVAAQPLARIDDQLALARVAASEAGLLATEDEIAAIGAVLRARCDECSITTVARQYSTRVFDLTRRDSRAWVAFLRADGREPAHWPRAASWSAYRERWLRIYEAAGRVVRGELEHRCTSPVHHWGAPQAGSIDMRRALRAGWVRVDCGATRNAFWRVPAREED